jgi:UDP-N-acetylmuramate dehydrogenase
MPVAELVAALGQVPGISIRIEEPLKRHLPLRVGGPVQVWAEARDTEALIAALRSARAQNVSWRVHWPFADWLVRDGGLAGAVFRLGMHFEAVSIDDDGVHLGTAALWAALPSALTGPLWDEMRTWPGSVGGWLEQGIDEALADCCTAFTVLQGGRVQTIDIDPTAGWPVLNKTAIPLRITLMRVPPTGLELLPPPPPGALFGEVEDSTPGRELERAGITGTRLRRWRLASREPGSLVHLGGGSCKDVLMLVNGVRHRVQKLRGAKLEIRMPVLGNEPGRRRG